MHTISYLISTDDLDFENIVLDEEPSSNIYIFCIGCRITRRLKPLCISVIFSIVNENQVAYVNNRFINESGRLISDVLEITNSFDIEGILITVDIEKAFDSINHSFLMCVLKNLNLAKIFENGCKS